MDGVEIEYIAGHIFATLARYDAVFTTFEAIYYMVVLATRMNFANSL